MKTSEYIKVLREIIKEHGDLEVEKSPTGHRIPAQNPEVTFRKILKGRESNQCFWNDWDDPNQKGDKVIRI